ncbi:hypothetical protein EVAR_33380_1 [Eumeta japonica]|uniref:Uncharacterized protein n=1 Tax=Eumeta variegata TaxID=151549 RepID=A0A4C1X4A8_EUMVA|nr:hypothetical protein EVAR_33380_1 [Eumeta japonica]
MGCNLIRLKSDREYITRPEIRPFDSINDSFFPNPHVSRAGARPSSFPEESIKIKGVVYYSTPRRRVAAPAPAPAPPPYFIWDSNA